MIFYKYCPPHHRKPLRDYTLRITQFVQLNDPFDCLPLVSMSQDDLDELWLEHAFGLFVKRGGKGGRVDPEFQNFAKQDPKAEQTFKERRSKQPGEDDRTRDFSRGFQEGFSERGGVVCLSERADSLLMWSHYAERHQGYVIGVDPALLEIPNVQGHIGVLRPVIYQDERVRATLRANDFEFIYRKSTDWAYEKEWRLVLPLSEGRNLPLSPVCQSCGIAKPPVTEVESAPLMSDIWVREFGAQWLREIIIGCRAGDELKDEIKQVKANMPRVKVRHARPSAFHHSMILRDEHKDWDDLNAGTTWTH